MNTKQHYYEQILQLKEAKDFWRVLNKWDRLSQNLQSNPNAAMVLPDLFWVAKNGVGKTHLLSLLAKYLYKCGNLMEFYGNVRYFEFMLDYTPPHAQFTEINRLINEVNIAAGFRNVYKGIISLDVQEWLGHCEEKHFLAFLEYLSANSAEWLIVFNVTGDDKEQIQQLESVLSMYFRMEKSQLDYPSTDDLLAFVCQRLADYNITLQADAQQLILATIEQLRKNKYFDGYKTLIMLCQDIAYEIFSVDTNVCTQVTADRLASFAPNSDYVARATWNAQNKGKIGLLN